MPVIRTDGMFLYFYTAITQWDSVNNKVKMKFYLENNNAAQKQTQSAICMFTCWDTVLEVLVIFSDNICHIFVRRK